MDNILDSLWVEKYRPKNLNEVILPEDHKKKFESYIKEKTIPHLLFCGGPGSGKTTVAKILTDSIIKNSSDILIFNGSTSTGVDMIRQNVVEFLSCPSFTSDSIKIVHIEEADYLSSNAQAALRNVMEEYYSVGRFLFTINYSYKILKELHSRFQTFEFKSLSNQYIYNHILRILNSEKIKFDEKYIKKVIKIYSPDVRMIIGKIQSSVINNELVSKDEVETIENIFKKFIHSIISAIENEDLNELNSIRKKIIQFLAQNELNYCDFYESCIDDDSLPFWVSYQISKAALSHSTALNPYINLMAMIYALIDVGVSSKM